MSRHEGVSCDSCLKTNFRCRRYKCLICYDYDLCATCYEDGVTTTRHLAEHPMQCILTRSDFELYYGGEVLGSDQPQSFTCPFCKKMGFSDAALYEHVSAEHTDNGYEVVCPVCAAMPGGDPNLVTDDFAGHLTIEHRTGNRDLISFLDEPSAIRHGGVRRIPHSGRPINGPRPRRTNSGLPVIYPVGRDPTAEILFQLSGGRLGAPAPSQLQQLQTQIQLERQRVSAARQHLEPLPRLPTVYTSLTGGVGSASTSNGSAVSTIAAPQQAQNGIITSVVSSVPTASALAATPLNQSQSLLNRFMSTIHGENENAQLDTDRSDRSQYVLNILLSTLSNIELSDEQECPNEQSVDDADRNVNIDKKSNDLNPSIDIDAVRIDDIKLSNVTAANQIQLSIGHQQQHHYQSNIQSQPQQQQQQQQRIAGQPKQKSPTTNDANLKTSRKTAGTQTAQTVTAAAGGVKNRELKTASSTSSPLSQTSITATTTTTTSSAVMAAAAAALPATTISLSTTTPSSTATTTTTTTIQPAVCSNRNNSDNMDDCR